MGKPESTSSRSSLFPNPFRPRRASPAPSNNSLAPPPSYTEATRSVDNPAQAISAPSSSVVAPPVVSLPSSETRTRAHPHITRASASTKDDPYAFLTSFDTVFLIDDSGSMRGSNWDETQAALEAIVPICTEHDDDGIDLYFLNHTTIDEGDREKGSAGTGYRGIKKPKDVQDIFRSVTPNRGTPTAQRLRYILNAYMSTYKQKVQETGDETILKPLNVIIITDGAPNDEPDGEIRRVANALDKLDAPLYQVGIQFFQVGNDPKATEALRDLDDGLPIKYPGMRDMVDTATFDDRPDTTKTGVNFFRSNKTSTKLTSDTVLKVVLGAVVRRLDRVETRQC